AAVSLSIQTGTVRDLVSPAPFAEGAKWLRLAATPPGEWTSVVDELRQARREVRFELGRLIRGDRAGLLGGVDLGGRVGDERVQETIAALARGRVRDLRQRLTRAPLRPELGLGDPDVGRRGRDVRAFLAEAVAEHLSDGLIPDLGDRRRGATAR